MSSNSGSNEPPTRTFTTQEVNAIRRRHRRRWWILAAVVLAIGGTIAGLLLSGAVNVSAGSSSATAATAATTGSFDQHTATVSVDKFTEHATRDQIRALVVHMAQIHVRTINVLVEWRALEQSPGHWANYPWLTLAPQIAWYNHGHPNAPPMQWTVTLAFAPSWATGVSDQDCLGKILCAPAPGHFTAYGLAARHISDYAHSLGNVPTEVWVGQQSNIAKLFQGGSPSVLTGMANAACSELRGTGTPVAIGELAPSGDLAPDLSPSTFYQHMVNDQLKTGCIAQVVLGPTDHDTGWQGDKITRLPTMAHMPIGVVFNFATLSQLRHDVARWANNTFHKGTVGGYWTGGDNVSLIQHHLTAFRHALQGG